MKIKTYLKLAFICLILGVFFSFLNAGNLDTIYTASKSHYNLGKYEDAEKDLLYLIEQNYENEYIYFILGRVYRKQEKHKDAIKYLLKYISLSNSRENLMYAKVNLAYEYLKVRNKKNIELAKKLVDEVNESQYSEDDDATYCYATVYNRFGFFHMKSVEKKPNDYEIDSYYKAVEYFKKALEKREELVGIANNLVVVYIRIIENLPNKDLRREEYKELSHKLLSKDIYKKYRKKGENWKKTYDYFYEKVCPECRFSSE